MKVAPVVAELELRSDRFDSVLIHTGQHYDDAMSAIFFEELGVRSPDHLLGVGQGTHAQQTARVMERLDPLLHQIRPDLVLVAGDVNSTLGAALTAVKLGIPVAHLEAGLRSFDRSMPEEINRVVTDAIADVHLIHSPEARAHLLREGIGDGSIHAVGNTMIDTLVALRGRPEVQASPSKHDLESGNYFLVTLHRPSLVDGALLEQALARLSDVAAELRVVFPVHPRTRARLDALGRAKTAALHLLPPLGYLEFLGLTAAAAGVLTDSGGVQEETTALGVPCFTLRDTTERPTTVELGTNTLLGLSPARIAEIPRMLREACARTARIPPQWDGHAAPRAVDAIEQFLAERSLTREHRAVV
jgi:UDP-N-acetylglucosamine 2-epimerase (non-hydrolysing)